MGDVLNERLRVAVGEGDVGAIVDLIAAGADVNFGAGMALHTVLHLAARRDFPDAVTALIHAGAGVDSTDDEGGTPLMWAAWFGSQRAMEVLLAAGANVACFHRDGYTALHLAARSGHADAVRLLLEAGAATEAVNCRNERPIDTVRNIVAGEG